MDAFLKNILEQMPLSELEILIEQKRKMLTPKKRTQDDEIKEYLLKNVLKYKNKLITKN